MFLTDCLWLQGLAYQQKYTPEIGASLELQPPIHYLSGYSGIGVRPSIDRTLASI